MREFDVGIVLCWCILFVFVCAFIYCIVYFRLTCVIARILPAMR